MSQPHKSHEPWSCLGNRETCHMNKELFKKLHAFRLGVGRCKRMSDAIQIRSNVFLGQCGLRAEMWEMGPLVNILEGICCPYCIYALAPSHHHYQHQLCLGLRHEALMRIKIQNDSDRYNIKPFEPPSILKYIDPNTSLYQITNVLHCLPLGTHQQHGP
jgi:hypothetical protein